MSLKSQKPDPPQGVQTEPDPGRDRLDRLARRYYLPLATFFRKRTRDASEVQDLVQQVFLRLAQCRDVDAIQNTDGYIFQTASNALKDYRRNVAVRERYVSVGSEATEHARSDLSPERVLLGKESVALLVDALRTLPERTRDIVMLRCLEGLKHGEIARLQGLSTRAVEKHVQRGLLHLARALEHSSEGVKHGP